LNSRPVRTLITIVMDLFIVVAVALTIRLVVVFFGQLAAQGWGKVIVALTSPLLIPFGVAAIKTPYGGAFEVATALTIVAVLLLEWMLSGIRNRA
jgi:uncharacterized protein YggT (Ycf19 family)